MTTWAQVDVQLEAGECLDFVEQARDFQLAQHDGQQAVLEAVVEEDVGVGRRDDGAKTVLRQRPGRVLAAGTAAEILRASSTEAPGSAAGSARNPG